MENTHLCFETVANQLRIQILTALKNKPMNVNDLVKQLDVERTRVSHSLQMLRDCKFVHVKQQGKERIYEINVDSPFFVAKNAKQDALGIFAFIQDHKENVCMNCHKLKGDPHGSP